MKLLITLLLAAAAYAQTSTINGGRVVLGDWNAGGASSSIPHVIGTGAPSSGACNAAGHRGRSYVQLDASSRAAVLYVCSETGTGTGVYGWVLQSGGFSVGLGMPSIFGVSGSPLTSGGTINVTLNSAAANTFFAGPTSGAGATPAFRALVTADIPSLDTSIIGSGVFPSTRLPPCGASGGSHAAGLVPDPGASAGTTRFLREDCTWVAITGSNATQLQGRALASTAPTNKQLMGWNNGANQWEPSTLDFSWLPSVSGDGTLSSSGVLAVLKVNGQTPGGTCTNQFARSIDSSGRPTCATVATADTGFTTQPVNTNNTTPATTAYVDRIVDAGCVLASQAGFLLNGTDETTALNNWLSASYTAGGGCIQIDATKTLRADGQIINPTAGSSLPGGAGNSHPPFRVSGMGNSWGAEANNLSSKLDLRYAGSSNGGYQLAWVGMGNVIMDNLDIINGSGAGACNKILFTHNFTMRNVTASASATCTNPVLTAGGTTQPGSARTNSVTDWFNGQGMIINSRFGGPVKLGSSANGINVIGNLLFGASGQCPLQIIGFGTGGSNATRGAYIAGNTIQMNVGSCGIFLQNAENNLIDGNGFWDQNTNTEPAIDGDTTATRNVFTKNNFVDSSSNTLAGASLSSNNNLPYRDIPFTFSNNGAPLTAQTLFQTINISGYINQFYMESDVSGNATVTVKTTNAGTACSSATDISNGGETMTGASSKNDTTLTSWTRTFQTGTKVCISLSSPATITQLSGFVRLWEGR